MTIDHFNWGAETIRNGDCVLFTNMNSLNLDAEGRYIKIRPRSNWIVNGTPTVCDVLEVSDLPLQTSDTDFVLYLRNTKLNSLPDIKVENSTTENIMTLKTDGNMKLLVAQWQACHKMEKPSIS